MGNSKSKNGKKPENVLNMDLLMVDEESSKEDDLLSSPQNADLQDLPAVVDKRMPIPDNYGFPADSDMLDFDIEGFDESEKQGDKAKLAKIRKNPTLVKFTNILEASKARKNGAVKSIELESDGESQDIGSVHTLLDYDYNMEEVRNLFSEGNTDELISMLWNNKRREHNWLKAVHNDEVLEKEETFDYEALERGLEEAYGINETKGSVVNDTLSELRKSLLATQNEKLKSLKEQTKLMSIKIKNRIKDLKKEKKRRLRQSKTNNKRRTKSKIGFKSQFKSTKRKNSFMSKKTNSRAGSTKNKLELESLAGKSFISRTKSQKTMQFEADETDLKTRAEIAELKLLKKALITDLYFPGLLKWKVKSEVANGLFIGAKDIEIKQIYCNFDYRTLNEDGKRILVFDVKNLSARIGILELALKGSNKLASALGGMVNPTVKRLYLILKGAFRVHMLYNEETLTWEPLTKRNKFKLRIQKETKGVKNIRLPTTLINLLGSSVIPKVITNGFRDGLPQKLECFDETFRAKLAEILKTYGFSEQAIERMMFKEAPFLTSPLTNLHVKGIIDIEGDVDFNIWRAPLIAPTRYGAAARKALKIKSIEDAVQLDILLRSPRAKRAGFSTKSSATIEKLAVWRYKFGSFPLQELKTILGLICGTKDVTDNPSLVSAKVLFEVMERVEKLSKKPVNVTGTITDIKITVNVLEFYQNMQQNYVRYTLVHGKTQREIDNCFADVEEGLQMFLRFVKLKGQGSGRLSLLSLGPLIPRQKRRNVQNDQTNTGLGDQFGATMIKLENVYYRTTLNTFNKIKQIIEDERKQLNVSTQAYRRNDTKEYVLRFTLRDERQNKSRSHVNQKPKLPQRPRDRVKKLLPLTKAKKATAGRNTYVLTSIGELGLTGTNINLFAKDSPFGTVEITSDLIQAYLDNSFLDAIVDDGRIDHSEQTSMAKQFIRNNIAPVLQRNGFRKLATIGGMKSKTLLEQADILLRWLDGAIPYDPDFERQGSVEMYNKAGEMHEFLEEDPELFNLPPIFQDVKNEFVAQVNNIPFQLKSDGEVLSLTFSEEETKDEKPFSIKLKFRMELATLLSRE